MSALADISAVLLALALVALLVRGRAGTSPAFTTYLALCLTTNRLVTWWPEQFHTYQFWTLKEALYSVVGLVILADLARGALPAFASRARLIAFALTAAIAVGSAVAGAHAAGPWTYQALSVLNGCTVWGYVAFLTLTLWYRLPLEPLPRAIVHGFVLYLSAYGALLGMVRYLSPSALPYLAALDSGAYIATLCLWARAAVVRYDIVHVPAAAEA